MTEPLLNDAARLAIRRVLMEVVDGSPPPPCTSPEPPDGPSVYADAPVIGTGPRVKPGRRPAATAPQLPTVTPPEVQPPPAGALTAAERVARSIALALELWSERIEEPPGAGWQGIDRFIRSPLGLGWGTADAKTWKPGAAYDKNNMFSWCGAFVAFLLGSLGLALALRYKHLASTGRLLRAFRGTPRYIADLAQVQPGDVAVVSDGSLAEGEHIVFVLDVLPGGVLLTAEGNARGLGPDGKVYEGVVKRTRPLPKRFGGPGVNAKLRCPVSGRPQTMQVVHVYRFLDEDFTAPAA